MKILLAIILLGVIGCSNSQEVSKIKLLFQPVKTLQYEMILNSNDLHLEVITSCSFVQQNDSIFIKWVIDKINYKGSKDEEYGINDHYQRFVNEEFESIYNIYGRLLEDKNTAKVVNTGLLIAELPDFEIKKGDNWEGMKSAKPDMVFDKISTKYTCEEITNEETTLTVQMDFKEDNQNKNSSSIFSKTYDGYYLLDNTTGAVKKAKFYIHGFNGYSKLTGTIEINEISNK